MNVLFSLFVLIVANYLQINDISNNYKGVWDILFSLLFTNFAKSKKGEIMEKENIMTVDIEDFKKSQHILDYIDDDFAIVNSLDGIPYSNDTVRLNCFLIAVCVDSAGYQLPDVSVAGGRLAARSSQYTDQSYDAEP